MEKKKLSVILIGAGSRGKTYTDYVAKHSDDYEVVAVAEPIEARRNYIRDKHGLSDEQT